MTPEIPPTLVAWSFQLRPIWRRKEAEGEAPTRLKSVVSIPDRYGAVLGRS